MPNEKSDWDKIRDLLMPTAPIVSRAIIPDTGGIAGTMLSDVLGVENKPETIETVLCKATPEQISAIKNMQKKYEEKLIELAAENDKTFLKNTQKARNKEIAQVQEARKREFNLYFLAWTVVIAFFSICGILIFVELPTNQSNIVYMLLGTLGTGFVTVLSYFFGSSKGSAEKTAILADKDRK